MRGSSVLGLRQVASRHREMALGPALARDTCSGSANGHSCCGHTAFCGRALRLLVDSVPTRQGQPPPFTPGHTLGPSEDDVFQTGKLIFEIPEPSTKCSCGPQIQAFCWQRCGSMAVVGVDAVKLNLAPRRGRSNIRSIIFHTGVMLMLNLPDHCGTTSSPGVVRRQSGHSWSGHSIARLEPDPASTSVAPGASLHDLPAGQIGYRRCIETQLLQDL